MTEIRKVTLTDLQRKKLSRLWFIYGNNGTKNTSFNHKFIQRLLDSSEDHRGVFLEMRKGLSVSLAVIKRGVSVESIMLTQECIDAVDEILNRSK